MKKHLTRQGIVLIGMIMDSALFAVMTVLSIRLFFRLHGYIALYILIGLSIGTIVLLLRLKRKQSERMHTKLEEIRNEQLEQILLTDDETLSAILGLDRFILIRKPHPDMFDVLDAVRRKANAIGLIRSNESLLTIIRKYGPGIRVITIDEMIFSMFPSVEHRAKKKYTVTKPSPAVKYIGLSVLLLSASVFVGGKIYFRIISSICMLIALVLGLFAKHSGWKNLRIFLDNKSN